MLDGLGGFLGGEILPGQQEVNLQIIRPQRRRLLEGSQRRITDRLRSLQHGLPQRRIKREALGIDFDRLLQRIDCDRPVALIQLIDPLRIKHQGRRRRRFLRRPRMRQQASRRAEFDRA